MVINRSDREVIIVKKNNENDWKTKLADFSQTTFSDLDQFIDSNVIDLASVKQYQKKLSKAVLALMKLFEEKLK